MTKIELHDKLWLIYKLGYKEHSQICEMQDYKDTRNKASDIIDEILDIKTGDK